MADRFSGKRNPALAFHAGFTLVEILIVLVIIGSLVSLAVVNLGGDTGREAEDESRRLHALLRMGADLAILESREIGLQLHHSGYEFLELDPETGAWARFEEEDFAAHELGPNLSMELALEGGQSAKLGEQQTGAPGAVILFSSGEITPFSIDLTDASSERPGWRIASDGFSAISLSPIGALQ